MVQIFMLIVIAALVALLGKNRKIGYAWSFALCLFLSPIIGFIIIMCSAKKGVEFIDISKD